MFHIGTLSASEHTAKEGNGSSVFQGVPSQRTSSIPSHPTSSPVSFGPSTPVFCHMTLFVTMTALLCQMALPSTIEACLVFDI